MTDTGTSVPRVCEMCREEIPLCNMRIVQHGVEKIICMKCYIANFFLETNSPKFSMNGYPLQSAPTPEEWAKAQAKTTTRPRRMSACPKARGIACPAIPYCAHAVEHNETRYCKGSCQWGREGSCELLSVGVPEPLVDCGLDRNGVHRWIPPEGVREYCEELVAGWWKKGDFPK